MWCSAATKYKKHTRVTWEQSKSITTDLQLMFFVSLLSFFSFIPLVLSNPTTCGGTYTASRGVIQTPNFPHQFDTPINYEWIIDASHIAHCTYNTYSARTENYTLGSSNHGIVLYFTQMYVLRGLSFTEYYNYSNCENNLEDNSESKHEGRKIDVNLFTATYIQSCANFLVIRLNLDNVLGAHIRVLNNFLDVYGFNITYEISSTIRSNSCKMSSCGFTGYCYDNFEKFFCDCLPGFKGPNCFDGAKSRCFKNGVSVCKDNESCRLVGETAHKCENLIRKLGKSPSKGNARKVDVIKSTKHRLKSIRNYKKCDDCRISCPVNQKHKNICDCTKARRQVHHPQDVRYSGILSINISFSWSNASLKMEDYFQEEITRTVQICKATIKNLTIEKIDNILSNNIVYFHFSGSRVDQNELQTCFSNFPYDDSGNFKFVEENITLTIQPTLFLERLSNNKRQPIHEGQEFILSCLAIGSPNMAFRWYKDEMFINITNPAKSNKWMQLVQKDVNNNNEGGAYWSVLVVSDANVLDEGTFTCQVIDDGRVQCASREVFVIVTPTVYIEPMSLTVQQGEAFFIKCGHPRITLNSERCHFNWLEDGVQLLNRAELLHPIGSLLKIPGINKTTTYSCSESCIGEDIFNEATTTVYVYDSLKEIPCRAEGITNQNFVHWPDTAPQVVSIVPCSESHYGSVTRLCMISNQTYPDSSILKGKVIGEWDEPDYSGCLHKKLYLLRGNFEKLQLGYETTTVLKIINQYKNHVISKYGHILSSEGRRIFSLLDDVLTYIENSNNFRNIQNIASAILDITDVLLSNSKAIYTKSDIVVMQQVVKRTLVLLGKTVETFEFVRNEFSIALNDNCNDQSNESNNKKILLCIYYFNLIHKVSKVKNNSTAEYQLISDIKTVFVFNTNVATDEANELTVSFNIADWANLDEINKLHNEWQAQCVASDWGFDWIENTCTTDINVVRRIVTCTCGTGGTFAVAYVNKLRESYGTIGINHVLIPLLYAVSLLLSLVCVLISINQFLSNKSAVSFMLSHSSLSKLINCGVFAFGTCSKFPQESYLYVLTLILFSYLLALSSQLAILMITYSELEDVLHKEGAKIAVVEIFIVGSILVTIGNHIAHTSNALRAVSWWIKVTDHLSFSVFIICLIVMTLLFITLYWIVWNFISNEITLGSMFVYKKYNRIRKCSYIFCAFLANVIASIFYINFVENVILNYTLVFTFILIDIMILFFITNCQRFHLKEITTKMRKRTKWNMDKSIKRLYIFNKN